MIDVEKVYFDAVGDYSYHLNGLAAVAAAVYEDSARICDDLSNVTSNDSEGRAIDECAIRIRSAAGGRERK